MIGIRKARSTEVPKIKVGIYGKTGSGKSTMMNMVGCLDRPSEGQCLVSGVDVGRLNAARRAEFRGRTVGVVFQNFHLLSRTSALENVELPIDRNTLLQPSL